MTTLKYNFLKHDPDAAEGGCGVVGFLASEPVRGIHIKTPCQQMHNRGNGKGGGVAAAGLVGEDLGIPQELLATHNLVAVAYLEPSAKAAVEDVLNDAYDIACQVELKPVCTPEEAGLDVRPPDMWIYMVEPKQEALDAFVRKEGLHTASEQSQRDHFVMATSDSINDRWYASMGDKEAFVTCHGQDILVVKVVGYAEQAAQYYGLDDVRAKAWIGHQRYPTKGVVWHPGGAHPFVAMHEALVHNGDFANYSSVAAYLRQFGVQPRFLTDTEVGVQLLDLYTRRFGYRLEWAIEALAPTTDLDLARLPAEKQSVYKRLQVSHVHGSPDGPWFFIILRNPPGEGMHLAAITDTSMLRPQVFAKMAGDGIEVALVGSERQAVDAALESMHADDSRIRPVADKYWNARGGSYTDGGAFVFRPVGDKVEIEDKFGNAVNLEDFGQPNSGDSQSASSAITEAIASPVEAPNILAHNIGGWSETQVEKWLAGIVEADAPATDRVQALNRLNDRPVKTAPHRPSWVTWRIREATKRFWTTQTDWPHFTIDSVFEARGVPETVVLDVTKSTPEGAKCPGLAVEHLVRQGARHLYVYGFRGQRFAGCGLGPDSDGIRLDLYDNVGDYTASGLDGGTVVIHMTAQDQMAQIIKRGELVIHGDVGQAFMYGAKGGDVFVRGNAAGRPLINATGRPRVVINGTCLDYLAESFMAGDPLEGGGFCIVNGVRDGPDGSLQELPEPYPGGNLFSLASGGAIYIRDPRRLVSPDQLNGGEIIDMQDADWALIEGHLKRNEEHFGIKLDELLTVDGVKRPGPEVYRKVQPVKLKAMARLAHG